MAWSNKAYFRCPNLQCGELSCKYGCTEEWPLCHMFLEHKCHWQYRTGYCYKGYHFRSSDDNNAPPMKKRRRDHPASSKTFQTDQEQEDKQDLRLSRLGFFDGEPLTQDMLEKAYSSNKNDVETSELPTKVKVFQIKKLKSAFRNVGKALHGQVPSPSTDDDNDEEP